MNIYVFSDESGVFDKIHNDYYVFGGIIVIDNTGKAEWEHKYAAAEAVIRSRKSVDKNYELKATQITNDEKGKLFRSLNNCHKFAVIVDQNKVLNRIYLSKKDKQRYLDYVYKIAVKNAFIDLINKKVINPETVDNIYFNVDEHTTATNGRYELREALEQELKNGTYNSTYNLFFPPVFPKVKTVEVNFCNSAKKLLVRAADIVSNRVYNLQISEKQDKLDLIKNIVITRLP